MNSKDYKMYIDYKQQKEELWRQCTDKYIEDVDKLENSYKDSMENIKEVESMVKHKKSLGEIIMEIFLLCMIELLSWTPFVMTKQGRINHLGNIIPIMFIIFGTLWVILFLVEVKRSIKCYIKYNKITKK